MVNAQSNPLPKGPIAMAQGKVGFRKAAPKGVQAEPETILKADKTILVVKAEKDGKLRFRCNASGMTPRWFLRA